MTVITPPYQLPDLRPFRTIQNKMRLQGGAVVTENGSIEFFDRQGRLIARLAPGEWSLGNLYDPGARLVLDPVGGLRFRNDDDVLVSLLDGNGYSLRDGTTGLVVAEIGQGQLRLVDPDGSDDIELVTSSAGTLPNPTYRSAVEANPGASLVVPASPIFTVIPDDLAIAHVAAFIGGTVQSDACTTPAGWTERIDTDVNSATDTLEVCLATDTPADGATLTFTSGQTNWQHGIGTHIMIRGGGASSPSYRSSSEVSAVTTAKAATVSMTKPTGTAATDVLVAIVAFGNYGGGPPLGWETPEGWVFLGANLRVTGSGGTQSTLAVGAWAKQAGASEPSTYETDISFGLGRKTIHASMVCVQNAALIPGGVQIRIAGHPMRRLLDEKELTSASGTLCDFTNIPASYDHLELVFNGQSDRATDALRNVRVRFNGDSGANYHTHINRTGVYNQSLSTNQLLVACLNGAFAGHDCAGKMTVFNYTEAHRRIITTEALSVIAGTLIHDDHRGMWLNTSDPIDQITVEVDGGTVLFDVGSSAQLYGY